MLPLCCASIVAQPDPVIADSRADPLGACGLDRGRGPFWGWHFNENQISTIFLMSHRIRNMRRNRKKPTKVLMM